MILYWIQTHEHHPNLPILLSQIYNEDCYYVLSVDGSSKLVVDTSRLPDNVCVRRGPPLTWAGFSQALDIADGLAYALARFPSWKYIVNLSAADIALRPSGELIKFLDNAHSRGVDGFIDMYGGLSKSTDLFSSWDRFEANTSGEESHVRLMIEKRIEAVASQQANELFTAEGTNPIMNFRMRPLFHCYDVQGEKTFVLRRPTRWEMERRRGFIETFGHTAGRSWYVLGRRLVSAFVEDKFSSHIMAFLENIICCDEMLMQTWVENMREKLSLRIDHYNLRFKQGAPEYIADHLFDELMSPKDFFARKIVMAQSVRLRQALAEKLTGPLSPDFWQSLISSWPEGQAA
jgi:hypothetical protein